MTRLQKLKAHDEHVDLGRVDPQTVAMQAHGLQELVKVLNQEGIVNGGCQLYVSYVARAKVAIESTSHTTRKGLINA